MLTTRDAHPLCACHPAGHGYASTLVCEVLHTMMQAAKPAWKESVCMAGKDDTRQEGTQAWADGDAALCFLDATELARLIRLKQVSAREVVAAHLAQIERVNPAVNAIVTLVADQAMEEASRADESLAHGALLGPLHGLPVAHKDLHDTKGLRTTYGSPLFRDFVPVEDAMIVERIKRAGAITIGKTNTPEFGAGSQTFNTVFGKTLNPYDPTKTCGGSSGGAAVALACGMVPLADGSDMGGSLRNPASFCNVVGLRPAPGRVPSRSRINAWSTLAVDGPMGRTVADVAFFLSVIAGPDPRSPIAIAEPGDRFAAPLDCDPHGKRVAWAGDLGGVPFDSAVRRVVEAQRPVFAALGCTVEDAEPDFTGADEIFKVLRAWHFEANYADMVRVARQQIKDTVIEEVERGARLTGPQVSRAEARRTEIYHRVRGFFESYDFLVLPTTQVAPFDVQQPYVTAIEGQPMQSYIDWMRSCYFISTVGNPAISVPCGFTEDGLPVGLQIVGRHRDEWSILQLAHAFEQATGYGKRRPPVVG
jgi:amidase